MSYSIRDYSVIVAASVGMYLASQIHLSLPGLHVPITLQTLTCIALPLIFGKVRASLGITLFLLLGAFGLPVYAEHSGGIEHLFGSSGGYLIGFLLAALLTWKVKATSMVIRFIHYVVQFTILQLFILFTGALWITLSIPGWHDYISPFFLPLTIKAILGAVLIIVLELSVFRDRLAQHS